jgi:single-strand DNA-binding protein
MRGINRVTLVGNLGDDPNVKTLSNNIKVAKCSIATPDVFRTKGGETSTDTQWHTIIFWSSLAELAGNYLKKGQPVYVEGKIKYRTYEDKSAVTRYVTEIHADSLVMLNKPDA